MAGASQSLDRRVWFNMQTLVSSLIPTIVAVVVVFVGMNKNLALVEQRLDQFEEKLQDTRINTVSRVEFNNLQSQVRLRSDDPYKGSDAMRDFQLRDFRINRIESELKDIDIYLHRIYPDWKDHDHDQKVKKGRKREE